MNLIDKIRRALKQFRMRAKCLKEGHRFVIDHIDHQGQLVATECYYCGKKEYN
jgi:hypothetical protein